MSNTEHYKGKSGRYEQQKHPCGYKIISVSRMNILRICAHFPNTESALSTHSLWGKK